MHSYFQAPDRTRVRGNWKVNHAFKPYKNTKQHQKRDSTTQNSNRSGACVNLLAVHLLETYQSINPDFAYESAANPRRVLTLPSTPLEDCEFDNHEHNYILHVNDVIVGPRRKFVVEDLLGTGSFGQVVRCVEKGTGDTVAIKLVKNLPAYHSQGLVEVSILEKLNQRFDPDQFPLVKLHDHFVFRSHLCLVFELLGVSLFDLLKMNKYHGLSLKLVRIFMEQILLGLQCFDELGIIHCDLKPENILLEDSSSPAIKIIDMGSACFTNQTVYTYIQSRFYRAPEVLLGLPYNGAIDVWSAGAVCFELFWGLPIFPGQNQHRMLKRIERCIGPPPESMLHQGKYTSKFYEKDNLGDYQIKSDRQYSIEQKIGKIPQFRDYFKGATTLEEMIHVYSYKSSLSKAERLAERKEREALVDFLACMLVWDPLKRWKPSRLLQHPFITKQPLSVLGPQRGGLLIASSFSPGGGVSRSEDIQVGTPPSSYLSPEGHFYPLTPSLRHYIGPNGRTRANPQCYYYGPPPPSASSSYPPRPSALATQSSSSSSSSKSPKTNDSSLGTSAPQGWSGGGASATSASSRSGGGKAKRKQYKSQKMDISSEESEEEEEEEEEKIEHEGRNSGENEDMLFDMEDEDEDEEEAEEDSTSSSVTPYPSSPSSSSPSNSDSSYMASSESTPVLFAPPPAHGGGVTGGREGSRRNSGGKDALATEMSSLSLGPSSSLAPPPSSLLGPSTPVLYGTSPPTHGPLSQGKNLLFSPIGSTTPPQLSGNDPAYSTLYGKVKDAKSHLGFSPKK